MCFPVIVQWVWTPLFEASRCGYDKVVEVLLTAGADVNFGNEVSYGLKSLPPTYVDTKQSILNILHSTKIQTFLYFIP